MPLKPEEISSEEKRKVLLDNGWSLYYHQDYWVNPKVVSDARQDYTNYGMNLNDAYDFEVNNKTPIEPSRELIETFKFIQQLKDRKL